MHIMEAYTNLLKVWKHPSLQNRLEEMIMIFLHKIINPSYHLTMFFTRDWTPTSREIFYGHDIEISWLIIESAQALGKSNLLEKAKNIAVKTAQSSLRENSPSRWGHVL